MSFLSASGEDALQEVRRAPGGPGDSSRWFSSRKDGVGAACNALRRVWFTLGEGVPNEIYYPGADTPCTRDLELIVTDGAGYFSDERPDTVSETSWVEAGVPAFQVINTAKDGRYRLRKRLVVDPRRPVFLQEVQFDAEESLGLRLFALLTPHLDNEREPNDAWVEDYKGVPMLFARAGGDCLAFAVSSGWKARSVGYVGKSDGWRELREHGRLVGRYQEARAGNVALAGEMGAAGETYRLAIGFGASPAAAAYHARAALSEDLEEIWNAYREEWRHWLKRVKGKSEAVVTSAAVLHVHGSAWFPGGYIASLSVPWGARETDHDAGGYHLVWPRDACHTAMGLLAAGAEEEARRTLDYFAMTQEADGRWPQRMWLDGTSRWGKLQLDAVASPILLFDAVLRQGAEDRTLERYWPMVRKAAGFIVRNGPTTDQDRWERNGGFALYTIATAIAALAIAAEGAERMGEGALAVYLRETAEIWNGQVERWLYVSDTALAREHGVAGYYCRVVPADKEGRPRFDLRYRVANSLFQQEEDPADVVTPDVLALVHFGLRPPEDRRVVETLRVVDATLRTETPGGPVWRRYSRDGYGEPPDGSLYRDRGLGRGWPLLTGERAHYELIAGRTEEARRLLRTLEAFASETGLLPEQVWDAEPIPEKQLFPGRSTGSAQPLAWAHAEHLKLVRSLHDGLSFTMPESARRLFLESSAPVRRVPWRFDLQTNSIPRGALLRIETRARAVIHSNRGEKETIDAGLGMHYADFDLQEESLKFTFFWPEAERWEGREFCVEQEVV